MTALGFFLAIVGVAIGVTTLCMGVDSGDVVVIVISLFAIVTGVIALAIGVSL